MQNTSDHCDIPPSIVTTFNDYTIRMKCNIPACFWSILTVWIKSSSQDESYLEPMSHNQWQLDGPLRWRQPPWRLNGYQCKVLLQLLFLDSEVPNRLPTINDQNMTAHNLVIGWDHMLKLHLGTICNYSMLPKILIKIWKYHYSMPN